MNILKRFNKRTSLFLISFFSVALLYLKFLPDAGGNEQCSKLLGADLEEEFGMEFIPQWTIKDFTTTLFFDIFRYKASWNEYKDLEKFLITQNWHVREGRSGDECMQTARASSYFDIQNAFIIERFDGKVSRQIIYDKNNAILYFEYSLR